MMRDSASVTARIRRELNHVGVLLGLVLLAVYALPTVVILGWLAVVGL
jgi:hypothetical protein